MSFQTDELRILLRTIAETRGADQMRTSLGQVRQAAASTSQGLTGLAQTTKTSAASMAQFALAAAGVGSAVVLAHQAVGALKQGVVDSVLAAAEAVRQQRTLAATYGSNTEQINRLATALRAVGVAQSDVNTSAITTDTLIKNYGLTIQQIQTLITRTNDLAVAQGRDLPDSVKRVSDAIRGEAEASEALGLTLNRDFLAEQRRKQGLQGAFDQLSQNTRAQITFNEFLRQSEQFSGQAAKATGELDGSMRRLDTATKELGVSFGKLFGPAVTQGSNRLTGVVGRLDELLTRLREIGRVMDDPKIQFALGIGVALSGGAVPGLAARTVAGPSSFRPTGAALSLVELDASRQPSASDRTAFEANARVERERAARESRRLLELNQNLPTQSVDRSLAEISFLDQRDAAIRDILKSEREGRDIQLEQRNLAIEEARQIQAMLPQRQAIAELERQITDQVNQRLRLQQEAAHIAAEQRAAPAQNALEDTQDAVARARLVVADRRNQTPEDRLAARKTIRDAGRGGLAHQELAAFDANQEIKGVEREQRATDLASRAAQNPLQQLLVGLQATIAPQERTLLAIQQAAQEQTNLANIVAARTTTHQERLEQIINKAITDGFVAAAKQPQSIHLVVKDDEGNTIIDQLIEATGEAQPPPVIKLSGAR